MKKIPFLFVGTSEFAVDCLKILIKLEALDLKGVITRPDAIKGRGLKLLSSPIKDFSKKQEIKTWTPENPNDKNFIYAIKQEQCLFSFVCSYGKILPNDYLNIFPKGSLNLHLSLLPYWRGAAPIQRALMAGDTITGCSLQIITKELDAGDIIAQRKFEITEQDNAEDLFTKSLKESHKIFQNELISYLTDQIKAQTQNHTQKTYAEKILKKECEILWKDSAKNIHNKIRALFLGPQAFSFLQQKRLKIYRSKYLNTSFNNFLPGQVCKITKNEMFIACGKGALQILEVQKESKKKKNIEDFLQGNSIKLRDSLGL